MISPPNLKRKHNPMTILLTGGTGMLGRNLRDVANANGVPILTPGRADLDLTSAQNVRDWLSKHKPDLIIHCAGHVGGIQANIASPVDFLTLNLDMGVNLVRLAHEVGVPRLINVASSCMYPRNAPNPLTEDMVLTGELEPTNEGYALAKIVTTRLCEYIARSSSLSLYRTLIPCNLYGRYDHFEPARSHLIPAVVNKVDQALRSGAMSIELWGDGSARREFMFAEDAARIIFGAANRIEELQQNMNIGLGRDYSVLDYYQAMAAVAGWSGTYDFDLTKPTGMKQKLVDITHQSALGLNALTSLSSGLKQTYEYFLETRHDS